MRLVRFALRRPITIVIAVFAVVFFSLLAIGRMPVDIFPQLGAPTIYIAQPYGGMTPTQMEGFLTYYYEYHLLYVTGIRNVESRSIQGAALIKCTFHPGTDMTAALAEIVASTNRSRSFMPPGTVPPFITRFDAGSVAVGQLVFRSETRSTGEMQDIAINRVRPLFAALEGVSAPPPFGGAAKTVVLRLDPDKLREYKVSPEEAIAASLRGSTVMPAGNLRIGDQNLFASTNATLAGAVEGLLEAPIRPGAGPSIYLRDVGTIEVGTDIVTGYAHVNGARTVYIPVTKRADASTLRVIERVRAALPDMQAAVPEDVTVTLEFDQSRYVASAIRNLVTEAWLGALLTGIAVLLFLRDWRGALVVITTIPAALLSAAVWLWVSGQTINIMTLAGLALAVGILVDEATVEIENIHAHLASGLSRARSVLDACKKTAVPRLLAMVAILSVFAPAFLMEGVVRQLFVPLALAVGFAMISSYVLSSSLVPVMSMWLLRKGSGHGEDTALGRLYGAYVDRVVAARWLVAGFYTAAAAVLLVLLAPRLGQEVFPQAGDNFLQLRIRARDGARVEKTEREVLRVLSLIEEEAGKEHLAISTAFIGTPPSANPVNMIHIFTSGQHEAVLKAELRRDAPLQGEALRERLRARFAKDLPGAVVRFEPGDIVGQVMSFGASTPIEVAVQGANLASNRAHAEKLQAELAKLAILRDIQFEQMLDYPSIDVEIDRLRAAQFGLTMESVARSMVAATSSSRFIQPNYWRDPGSGNAFQIQVEIPYQRMDSLDELRRLPVMHNGAARPLLSDVATIKPATAPGIVERNNMQRVVSLTANLHGAALGEAARQIDAAIRRAGEPPRGAKVVLRGQIPPFVETTASLRFGVALSLVTIFLLLAAYFQSLRLGLAILSTTPGVLAGVTLMLFFTGTTLNVQSFLGAIMATGIAAANAILLCSFAEYERRAGVVPLEAARRGAKGRLRPILMTATAMTFGMVPIALGLGEGGAQTAPLGRAVIGGLIGATAATLTVLPAVYAILMRGARSHSASLDPEDPESRYHETA
jgi:multidrug efflux pump subunit AcrB